MNDLVKRLRAGFPGANRTISQQANMLAHEAADRLAILSDFVKKQNARIEALQAENARLKEGGKYDDVLIPFMSMMEAELHANSGKGDRPGWLAMDVKTALLEIYYHLAKLQKAAKNGDAEGIAEYSADVANMSMMLADICNVLPALQGEDANDLRVCKDREIEDEISWEELWGDDNG